MPLYDIVREPSMYTQHPITSLGDEITHRLCNVVRRRPHTTKHLLPHRHPNNHTPIRLFIPRAMYIPRPVQRHHPNHSHTLNNRETLPANPSNGSAISPT